MRTRALRLTIMYDSILSVDMLAAGARCTVTVAAVRIYISRATGARARWLVGPVEVGWMDWGVVGVWCTACGRVRRATWSPSCPPRPSPSSWCLLSARYAPSCRLPTHAASGSSHAAGRPCLPACRLHRVSRLWRRVPARRECASRWTDSSLGGGAAWRFHGAPARSQGVALPECVRRGPSVR